VSDRVERRRRLTPEQKWKIFLEASRMNTTDAEVCWGWGITPWQLRAIRDRVKERTRDHPSLGSLPPAHRGRRDRNPSGCARGSPRSPAASQVYATSYPARAGCSARGTQMTSRSTHSFFADLGIAQTFSRPRTPTDNAARESWMAALKCERLYEADTAERRHGKWRS
jgi:transposase InsO family protein